VNYRRVCAVVDLQSGAGGVFDLIRQVAPDAEFLQVVARSVTGPFAWLPSQAPPELAAAAEESLEALRNAASGAAKTVAVRVEPGAGGLLPDLVDAAEIDLLVTRTLADIPAVRRRRMLAVLWVPADASSPAARIEHVLCVALGQRARRAVGRFLRDHAAPDLRVTALVQRASPDAASVLEVAGIGALVQEVTAAPPGPFGLVVMARLPAALVAARMWRAPILVLPPVESGRAAPRAMEVADVVEEDGVIRLRARHALDLGRHEPIPDQQLAIVSGGRVVATVTSKGGAAEVVPALRASALGIYRVGERKGADPLSLVETELAVIRPGSRPLVLFDSNATELELRLLSRLEKLDLLAVRMRATERSDAIRARLTKSGLPPRVIDAPAVLDEGSALDVGPDLDAVRLARVARRMRAARFPVAAIVYRGPVQPSTDGFAALRADQALSDLPAQPPFPKDHSPGARLDAATLGARLDAATGAPLVAGNRIEIELDNGRARRWLLDAIAGAKRRVHLQIYMALDDDVGSKVEAALAAAGARGVTVRVAVDSLHGLHGSLGLKNPLLERLAGRPGVEIRLIAPITHAPTFLQLKQRDHRKLAVIDNEVALLGGRNLSHEYYAGFDEVRLTARSLWREVPWLDAGARVEGPAVASLEESFLDAWTSAGGAPFEISGRAPTGTAAARVVVHHGLRDTHTLDAYLAMIDSAESHVYTINGFPLLLEIQHALLRAIRRGVRVRTLFGNLTPTHGGTPFGGPWSSARTEATELVRSRMDDLVAAGAEAHEFEVPEQPVWEPNLGVIHPHVHAKVVSVDGRVCSVGSANLDVTAGYWENELLLIVEDPAIAGALESRIEELLVRSPRVDRNDPGWRSLAKRRTWMRRWPGEMSV
jgi:cardiolipin synthase